MVLDKTSAANLKKIIHNGIERSRKQRIFTLIDDIVNCLPFKHEFMNKSKRQKLERIHSYILDLKNKNDALMFANPNSVLAQEIQQLRKHIENLELMIISYQNLLKSAGISPDKLLIDPTIPDRWQKRPLKYSKPMRNPHVITSKQIPDDDDIVSSDDDEA
ncbi:basic helix-loop-helix domain-containing protein, partial [Euroglyphus maynei]